ncbi:hypothetical protein DFP72DRAFT_1070789 [Ephemerocybe angulata]|uniref:Uncharacterized protein n=1 Tax=Ephemerocybe angulata TaxID=980116 RepID=A0A8H6HS00_9AGAR|nr:hypothetical protein DFP72DRAFT_1070789 [Tulosesus angulatus]
MKFTLAPLATLLFGASYLVANAAAYSYNDYNELDARYQIDGVLSERGFGLEARETVDVPFQPSLRAFLEEAVTAHRRSISEDEEYLEARADDKMINVDAIVVNTDKNPPKVSLEVKPNMLLLMFVGAVEKKLKALGKPDNLHDYTPIIRNVAIRYSNRMSMRLNDPELGVKDGDTITFKYYIEVGPTPVSLQGIPIRTLPPKPTQRQ